MRDPIPGFERNCVCCGDIFTINSANHVRCIDCKNKGRKIPQ